MVRMFGVLYSYFSIVFLTLKGYINRLMVFHENKNESLCRVSDTTFPTSIDLVRLRENGWLYVKHNH